MAVTRHAGPSVCLYNETHRREEQGDLKGEEHSGKRQGIAKAGRGGMKWEKIQKRVKCTSRSWIGGLVSNRDVCFLTEIPLRRLCWKTDYSKRGCPSCTTCTSVACEQKLLGDNGMVKFVGTAPMFYTRHALAFPRTLFWIIDVFNYIV